MKKKKMLGIGAGLVFTLFIGWTFTWENERPPTMGGPIAYNIPAGYHTSASNGNISMIMSYPDAGPIHDGPGGWDNQILLLISSQINTIPDVYDTYHRKNPLKDSPIFLSEYKDENFTYKEMNLGRALGVGFDLIIPHQDMDLMKKGIITCSLETEIFKDPACSLLFDRDGQRWKISFGKQFLNDFEKTRISVQEKMDSYKVMIDNE